MSLGGEEVIGMVGLGAIGGSLALALKDRARVLGWSNDSADRAAAHAAGIQICEDAATWTDDIARATIIVIAVPLDEVAGVARALLRRLPDETLVVHVASLQACAALGVEEREWRGVIGTHPIAGSERSGFLAADSSMFRGATVFGEARATEAQRRRIDMLWREAGATRVSWEDAAAHDALMSWMSHLPQLTATALSAVLDQRGIPLSDTGAGARDTTRLAASALRVWAPILERAPRATVDAARALATTLNALAEAIEERDSRTVAAIWDDARRWRTATEPHA